MREHARATFLCTRLPFSLSTDPSIVTAYLDVNMHIHMTASTYVRASRTKEGVGSGAVDARVEEDEAARREEELLPGRPAVEHPQ